MSVRIDHSNYEAFLLDRMDGMLTPEQEHELDLFLLMHPELAPDDAPMPKLDGAVGSLTETERGSLKRALPPVGLPGEVPIDDLLIGRLEGDLSTDQLNALRVYLKAHPEYRETERLYALTKLLPSAMAFSLKNVLAREIPPSGSPDRYNLEDFLVAKMEGDLNVEQDKALTEMIAMDAAVARSWSILQHTKVQTSDLAYPNKADLKKGGKVIPFSHFNWARLAAAASVALLLGWGIWFWRTGVNGPSEIAVVPAVIIGSPTVEKNVLEEEYGSGPESGADPLMMKEEEVLPDLDREGSDHAVRRIQPVPTKGSSPEIAPERTLREEHLPIAESRPVLPEFEPQRVHPISAVVQDIPTSTDVLARAQVEEQPEKGAISLRELLANTVRERVLERPERDTRPLGGDDALAAVDRGLKLVAGNEAGLEVAAKTTGSDRGFNLRLGHNFSISR